MTIFNSNKMHLKLLTLFIFLFIPLQSISAKKVCKFSYIGMPEDLHDSVIIINEDAVAMSDYIYVGTPMDSVLGGTTSSIFFIIDHSKSMGSFINPDSGNDQWGSRFTVTSALLDTIMKKNPFTQVGLSIFGSHLYFYERDDIKLFTPCPNAYTGQNRYESYIPLLTLGSKYESDILDSATGYKIIKHYLKSDTIDGSNTKYVDLIYKPFPDELKSRGTNISIGFEAAKRAMDSSSYPVERQFIIFFSDGKAEQPVSDPDFIEAYMEGEEVPTTFTIFFNPESDDFQKLKEMTENIKNNDYSESNKDSDLWPITTDHDTLMDLLMENVIGKIVEQLQTSMPVDLKINGTGSNSGWDGEGFTFDDLFPLVGWETDFNFSINYEIYRDSIDADGDTIHILVKDTTSNIRYTVKIEEGASVSDSILLDYWERRIEFYYDGEEVNYADETMKELEIRFTEEKVDVLYGYKNVKVILTTTEGSDIDRETFKLDEENDYFTYTFKREVDDPLQEDGTLQHKSPDSIVATFRNPDLPLDTLRIAIPYMLSGEIMLNKGIYYDRNADGNIDSIFIVISGKKVEDNIDELMEIIKLPKRRDFRVESYKYENGGIGVEVKERGTVYTGIRADDSLIVEKEVILENGGKLYPAKVGIIDSVAPVIMTANLRDSLKESGRDELYLTFSENVKAIEKDHPFKFFSIDDKIKYDVELAMLSVNGDSGIFEVKSVEGEDNIRDGDSIRINWNLDTNVYDKVGNNQNNKTNIRREIKVTVIKDMLVIKKGIYYDRNADGHLDRIIFQITGDKLIENFNDIKKILEVRLPAWRKLTIDTAYYVNGGISFDVKEGLDIDDIYTYVTDDDKVTIKMDIILSTGVEISKGDVDIVDSMAPVIMEASLADSLDPNRTDELTVVFSENVDQITVKQPFEFFHKDTLSTNPLVIDSVIYNVELDILSRDENVCVFKVNSVIGTESIEDGDSIRIDSSGKVYDTLGNEQDNHKNIRREISVETIPMKYKVIPKITLLDYGELIDLKKLKVQCENNPCIDSLFGLIDYQKSSGDMYKGIMVITVVPTDMNMITYKDSLFGEFSLYDALGNEILVAEEMCFERYNDVNDEMNMRLIYLWDGRNTNKRKVGLGTYKILIFVRFYCNGEEQKGRNCTLQKIVGVKK